MSRVCIEFKPNPLLYLHEQSRKLTTSFCNYRQDALPRELVDLPLKPCEYGSGGVPSYFCPDEEDIENLTIQGEYSKEKYEYLKVQIVKCLSDIEGECAPIEEIDKVIENGSVQAQVFVKSENFEVDTYHKTGRGIVGNQFGWRWYALPRMEQKVEIYVKAREIKTDERFVGSPPLPESTTLLYSFDRIEVVQRPMPVHEDNVFSWFIRMSPEVDQESVVYWMPSILDLFGLW